MVKSIQCQSIIKKEAKNLRIRVIKAPLVHTKELRQILFDRARALVL
ncbi:MAG: hypothetical protein ABH818_00560 [Patescibacteria group bacterium]|nr:hypothetical protein [Patescibacteria group bacterium]MBU1870506.1 hypothetical protein [Patescibacteria group bacterium]